MKTFKIWPIESALSKWKIPLSLSLMSERRIRMHILLKTAALLLSMAAFAQSSKSYPDLAQIFADGDFRPYVPSLEEVQKRYGPGKIVPINGLRYLIYSVDRDRCVVMKYEPTALPKNSIIQEISYTSKLGCRYSAPNIKTQIDSLYGVSVGEEVDQIKDLRAYRRGMGTIGGVGLEFVEFNPIEGETDLYVRYFIDRGKVMALSIGVAE
jgi:hypothetical protein